MTSDNPASPNQNKGNARSSLTLETRLEGLIHLNQLHFDRFTARREREWKASLTLWGGLGAVALAARGSDIEPLMFWISSAVMVTLIWLSIYVLEAPR